MILMFEVLESVFFIWYHQTSLVNSAYLMQFGFLFIYLIDKISKAILIKFFLKIILLLGTGCLLSFHEYDSIFLIEHRGFFFFKYLEGRLIFPYLKITSYTGLHCYSAK